jgi:DNA-directed RNA polymerase specialized sigma24 family protein
MDMKLALVDVLTTLPETDRLVMSMLADGNTYQLIGEAIHLSTQRVGQIVLRIRKQAQRLMQKQSISYRMGGKCMA